MKKEAELHADEDKKKQEAIETKNLADTIIYTTEKMLRDAGDKVKPEDKKIIEEKIEELKKIKEGNDIEAIKKAADELSQAAQKVGAAMYEAQKNAPAADSAAPGGAPSEDKKEEPIEGEVVDDKKE